MKVRWIVAERSEALRVAALRELHFLLCHYSFYRII